MCSNIIQNVSHRLSNPMFNICDCLINLKFVSIIDWPDLSVGQALCCLLKTCCDHSDFLAASHSHFSDAL